MAKRLFFLVNKNNEVEERYIEFQYIKGLAFSQKVKCAKSLQDAIIVQYPELRAIEVSTKSDKDLGIKLSAFNLKLNDIFVESIFQSSKVFDGNIQFDFLISYQPREAKKYIKENHVGNLIYFVYQGIKYPLYPKSAFYDWLYINALDKSENKNEILQFDAFSDIEFNDKKSINCQARAVALYVAMSRQGKKKYYLESFEKFIKIYDELCISNHISLI